MVKRKRVYIGIILFSILASLLIFIYPRCVVGYTKSKGDEIIAKVEMYKAEHEGLYPQSLRQLGFEVRDSDDICLYKGCEFYYDCICDIGGEFSLTFYYSDESYRYESVIKSWGKGDRAEERNMQLYKLYYKTVPPRQEELSDKWICDSVFYSTEDSQYVAKVRFFYKRNGSLAARGYILQDSPETRTGNWIYYTDSGESFNVTYCEPARDGAVIETLTAVPLCGTGLTDSRSWLFYPCIVIAGALILAGWIYRRKKKSSRATM